MRTFPWYGHNLKSVLEAHDCLQVVGSISDNDARYDCAQRAGGIEDALIPRGIVGFKRASLCRSCRQSQPIFACRTRIEGAKVVVIITVPIAPNQLCTFQKRLADSRVIKRNYPVSARVDRRQAHVQIILGQIIVDAGIEGIDIGSDHIGTGGSGQIAGPGDLIRRDAARKLTQDRLLICLEGLAVLMIEILNPSRSFNTIGLE